MSPEENLAALGLRQLLPTPLCDEDVKVEDAADFNGKPKASGPRPAETSSEQAEPAVEPGRESLVKLAAGDIAPFFELAERDPGFPFEPDTIVALNRLARDRRADFERLRSVLKAGKRVRLSALEAAMKAQAVGGGDAENRSGRAIEYDEIDPWDEPIKGAELLTALARAVDDYVIMEEHQRDAWSYGLCSRTPMTFSSLPRSWSSFHRRSAAARPDFKRCWRGLRRGPRP
jgi:hypothetical protein